MRPAILFAFILAAGSLYLYNTLWFQSNFIDSFYSRVVDIPFDVTTKGKSATFSIRHKFNTCYGLSIAVPDRSMADDRMTGEGQLKYKFTSGGRTLAQGITPRTSRHSWGGSDHISLQHLIVFDLPFIEASDELTLEVEVHEPFSYFEDYKKRTSLIVSPNYNHKSGECQHENLRIEQ